MGNCSFMIYSCCQIINYLLLGFGYGFLTESFSSQFWYILLALILIGLFSILSQKSVIFLFILPSLDSLKTLKM